MIPNLYNDVTTGCSELITKAYSTSFSLGIRTLDKRFHNPIYSIYGFVRLADEIVDTFHDHDKKRLLDEFRESTYVAIKEGLSLNPIINSFQLVVNQYHIEHELIDAFLNSMEMDLNHGSYNKKYYDQYIYGSAEVVGLMCLRVFCEGDELKYHQLRDSARRLGAAFQKVNFLRDMKSDYIERGRVYFPGANFTDFDESAKHLIESDIQADFDAAYIGIIALPSGARMGVYLSYVYYLALFKKIKQSTADMVKQKRIRVSDTNKMRLLLQTYLMNSLNIL
jgi:phytoene/squalene synthetase